MKESLKIRYSNQAGVESIYQVDGWSEVGHYIKGHVGGAPRTFRKDRVLEYLENRAAELVDPHPPAPPPVKTPDNRAQVLFTGFPSVQRADLERRAAEAGMKVCKTVTKDLEYLCCGPTAGPAKVEKSRAQGVYIMSPPQFFALIETGELPDDESTWV